MKTRTILIAGACALCAAAVILSGCNGKEIKLHTQKVETRSIEAVVTATGYVQPVDKVDVGTQVSGVIEKIFVDFNSQVKKGQLLAELDKSTLAEKLTQANAVLTSAQSDLLYAQRNFDRTDQLYAAKAATQAAHEQAVNALDQAKTNLANAKASLHQAQVNLSYAEIYSPIDGVVLNRAVEQGQTVAASFNTPTLFTIANDLTKMQVEANVDEADIGQVRLGQKVSFTVDSYTEDTFTGTVSQIRLQPAVTNNVVTYTVIIQAPNPDEKLYPGMTASVTITTHTEQGLAVTAEALKFKPTPALLKKYQAELPEENAKGVWIEQGEKIVFRPVRAGLSDGVYVIAEEGVAEGDQMVLSFSVGEPKENEQAAKNPLVPQRQQRK